MSVVFRNGNVAIKKLKDNKYKLDYEKGNYKHFWKFVKELIGEKNNNFEAHSVVSLKELLKEKWLDLFSNKGFKIDNIISPEIEVANMLARLVAVSGAHDLISFAEDKVRLIGLNSKEAIFERDEGSQVVINFKNQIIERQN